jgi:hypothetical protein
MAWKIIFSPYVRSRSLCYCPSDPVGRTRHQAQECPSYEREELPELDAALVGKVASESYLLNSLLTY